MTKLSPLQIERLKYQPKLPGKPTVTFESSPVSKESEVRNVGVILSGGQAPGGHNVIAGLYDALKNANSSNKLYGFLGGPSGIIEGKYVEFDDEFINAYRNTFPKREKFNSIETDN